MIQELHDPNWVLGIISTGVEAKKELHHLNWIVAIILIWLFLGSNPSPQLVVEVWEPPWLPTTLVNPKPPAAMRKKPLFVLGPLVCCVVCLLVEQKNRAPLVWAYYWYMGGLKPRPSRPPLSQLLTPQRTAHAHAEIRDLRNADLKLTLPPTRSEKTQQNQDEVSQNISWNLLNTKSRACIEQKMVVRDYMIEYWETYMLFDVLYRVWA